MTYVSRVACAALFLLLAAGRAQADGFVTPSIGFDFGDDVGSYCASLGNCEEKRTNWGLTLGSTSGIFGFEADFGYAPDFFGKTPDSNNAVFHFMADLMLVIPAGPIQPYGFVGLGIIRPHAEPNPANNLDISQNAFGHDWGGGLNLFVTHAVGLHGEVRHLMTFEDIHLAGFSDQKLAYWRASAGLTFRF